MNMTYRIGYWRARCRYEVGYFALKRASPAEQPRELIDRTSMSAPSSAQQDIRGACENARARIVRVPLRETGLPGRETKSCGDCRACACGVSQSGLRWFCRRSLEGQINPPFRRTA